MNLPPEATQPPAEQLVSYEEFLLRLDKLSSSPRVKVRRLGESHGGRGLYVIVIAEQQTISGLEGHRLLSTRIQMPRVVHPTLFELQKGEGVAPSDEARFPVLITGLSFGHEASHVEGHLKLAERLAWGEDEAVTTILDSLVVLVMPMLNADGRMMSIDIWSRYPLTADSSAGNLYGFYLNRDFLHLTQPEARAVAKVYKEWHPIALLDTHEDVFCLGVQVPEVCWCPYSGHAPVEEGPENILEKVSELGEAIRKEWHRLGFKYLERNMFAHPMPGEPEEGPYWMAGGNVVETMVLHGIPSVITESGRTPGVQTWHDRVEQKYSAGFSLLKQVAKDPGGIAQKMHANRAKAIEEAQEAAQAFIIPKNQRDLAALAQLVGVLLRQGVQVYETHHPYLAFVVPVAQAEADVARALLSTRDSKVVALPPALGVAVTQYDTLSQQERDAFKKAPLVPVVEASVPKIALNGEPHEGHYAVPNSTEGIRLVNRLWQLGATTRRLSQSVEAAGEEFERGTFLVEETRWSAIEELGRGLALQIRGLPPGTPVESHVLDRPKVALYVGQGVDRPDASARADLCWALEKMQFEFAPLEADDITEAVLSRYDTLIVPGGDAHEIVNGWNKDALLNKSPWELPGEPRGIGEAGLEALRTFVQQGGTYLGVGSGGGLLATSDYADLIDLQVMAHSLGSARVLLRVDEPDDPLMLGLNGYHDETGKWSPGFFPAYYHSETFTDTPGGPVFAAGRGATALASYYRVDHDPTSLQVIKESYLTEAHGGVAVASQPVGQGQVVVVGVRPGFRAVWTNTWKLVSNAIFLSVAGEAQTVTLP